MIPHFLQITDKWSKRRFVMKLNKPDEFRTFEDLALFLKNVTPEYIQGLLKDKRLSSNGLPALEDIRSAAFSIRDNGELGDMYDEVSFTIDGHMLFGDDALVFEQRQIDTSGYEKTYVANIILDRDCLPYTRNWDGYYKRYWNDTYKEYVVSIIKEACPEQYNDILMLKSREEIGTFWNIIAQKVATAPYEIYSRYLDRRVSFKTGPETLYDIMHGRGGNCSEKAAALDFIRVNFGLGGHMILSGNMADGTFPYTHLRNALNRGSTVFTGRNQKYWEHYANLFIAGDEKVLIDATGGPIPFLSVSGRTAEEYLSQKRSHHVRFIAQEEYYFYHDAPLDVTYDAFFNMEAFIPDIDLYHIFGPEDEDTPFGLYIRPDLWICPNAYRTADEYGEHKKSWREYADISDTISALEMYEDLSAASEKHILSELEEREPSLVEDLRRIDPVFQKRCRYMWRDDRWRISYVFCKIRSDG